MPEFLTKSRKKRSLSILVAVFFVLFYGGCDVSAQSTTSEALLEAEGNWNLVEESSSYDPALAHKQARDKVNPRNRKVNSELSPHFSPDAKSGQDGKMRVLKLQPESGAEEDLGYEVAETSISKPASKVVVPEVANKINALFEDRSVNTQVVEAKKADVVLPKAEKKDLDLFGKVAQLFSSDETLASQDDKAAQSPAFKEGKKIQLLAPKPLRVGDVALSEPITQQVSLPKPLDKKKVEAEIVVPRKLPARKVHRTVPITKTAVILASEFSAQKTKSGAQDVMSVDVGQDGKVHSIGMRAAMHPSKTRIAFDFSGAVKYKVAIDHIRNVLRVKFDNASWDQKLQGVLDKNSALLGSYVVRKQPDGSVLFEVRLKKKSAIKDTMILRPGTSPHHRVVIDLKN